MAEFPNLNPGCEWCWKTRFHGSLVQWAQELRSSVTSTDSIGYVPLVSLEPRIISKDTWPRAARLSPAGWLARVENAVEGLTRILATCEGRGVDGVCGIDDSPDSSLVLALAECVRVSVDLDAAHRLMQVTSAGIKSETAEYN